MASEKVELAQAYISLIPSARGIQTNLEKTLADPAAKAGRTAGATVSKEIRGGMADGLKASSKLVSGIGADMVKSMNLTGPLGAEVKSASALFKQMSSTFKIGFNDAEAAASSFTGVMGTLGGTTRKSLDAAAAPFQNLSAGFTSTEAAASALTGRMGTLGGTIRSGLETAAVPFQNLAAGFTSTDAAASALTGRMGTLGGATRTVYDKAAAPAQNFLSGLKSQDAASSALTGSMGTLGGATRTVFNKAAAPAQNFLSGLKSQDAASSALTGRMGTLGGAVSKVGSSMAGAWTKSVSGIGKVQTGIGNFVSGMRNADAAVSPVTGKLGTLGGQVSAAAGRFTTFKAEASDAASRVMSGVTGMTNSVVGFGVKAGLALGGVATGIAGVALTGGIKRALQIENSEAKLTGLGHSTQAVTGIMDNALASVKGTSFGLGEAASTAAGAVAAGIEPGDKLQGVLKTVANSAALAETDMSSMGSIFNKVAATGKLQGDVLLQLSDAGVPALSFLAKQTGKTAAEVSDMVSKGQIDFDTFAQAMEQGVGTAAAEMGKTTTGTFNNVKAALGRLGAGAVQPMLPLVQRLFSGFIVGVDALTDKAIPFFEKLAQKITGIGPALQGMTGGFDRVKGVLSGLGDSMPVQAMTGMAAVLAPVAAGIGAMAVNAVKLTGPIGGLLARFTPLAGILGKLAGGLKFLGGPWGMLISLIVTAVSTSDELKSSLGEMFGTVMSTLGPVVAGIGQAIGGVMATVGPLIGQLFGALVTAVQQILIAVMPVIKMLVDVLFTQLIPVFMQLVSAVLPPVVAIFGVVIQVISALLPPITMLIRFIVSMLVPVIQVLVTILSTLVTWIVQALTVAINWLVENVFPALGVAIQAVGAFFTWLWQNVAVPAWNAIQTAIQAVVTWFTTTAVPWFQSALNVLGTVFNWLYVNVIQPVWNGIKIAIAIAVAAIMTIFDGIMLVIRNVLAPLFTWLWQNVIVPVWNGISAAISWAWNNIILPIWNAINAFINNVLVPVFNWFKAVANAVWNAIGMAIQWVWNTIIKPVWEAIKWWIDFGLIPMFNWLKDVIKIVWNAIGTAIQWVWNTIIKPVWNAIKAFIDNILIPAFHWLRDRIADAWNGISSKISSAWGWIRDTVLKPMGDFLQGTVVDFFRKTKDGIKNVWDKIQDIVKKPVSFVINTVIRDGFVKHFNDIAGKFGVDPIKFDGVGWATGGYTGRGRKYDPAGIVHAGEYVVNQDSTNRIVREHGLGSMDYLNQTGDLAGALKRGRKGSAIDQGVSAMGAAATKPESGPLASNRGGSLDGVGAVTPPHGPGGIWGSLQKEVSNTGRFYVPDRNFMGVNMFDAAKAWMGRSAIDIRMGDGSPGINSLQTGGAGGWGYNSGSTIWMQGNVPQDRRAGVLRHELGHALSLHHVTSPESIMDPLMGGGDWPHSGDYAALVDTFGKPGDKAKTYDDDGSSGGGGWASKLMNALLDKFVRPLFDKVPGAGLMSDFVIGGGKKLMDGVVSWVASLFGGGSGGSSNDSEVSTSKDAEKWRPTVKDALGHVGLPTSNDYIDAWIRQIQSESGGNPNAVQGNIGDVNNATGDIGKGLVQVIGSTFDAYRDKSLPNNRFDPMAVLVAGMNYAKARYPGAMLDVIGHGHGYSGGGLVKPTLFDGGGWLENTGSAQLVEHRKRQPDAVLSNPQWKDMHTLAEQVRAGDLDGIKTENHFVVQERPERTPEHMIQRMVQQQAHEYRKAGLIR